MIVQVFCKIFKKYTLNMIGQCIGWFFVWYANFIEFEDPIDMFCENFSLLTEVKFHTVWKIIVHKRYMVSSSPHSKQA